MINVWATYCSPCLEEMPELGKLHNEYKGKGVQIAGIVLDASDAADSASERQVDFAKEIVSKTKADYTHILPNQELLSGPLCEVSAVPTTLFVDESGKIVGKTYLGAKSYDDWKKIIEDTLKEVKQ